MKLYSSYFAIFRWRRRYVNEFRKADAQDKVTSYMLPRLTACMDQTLSVDNAAILDCLCALNSVRYLLPKGI